VEVLELATHSGWIAERRGDRRALCSR